MIGGGDLWGWLAERAQRWLCGVGAGDRYGAMFAPHPISMDLHLVSVLCSTLRSNYVLTSITRWPFLWSSSWLRLMLRLDTVLVRQS